MNKELKEWVKSEIEINKKMRRERSSDAVQTQYFYYDGKVIAYMHVLDKIKELEVNNGGE